MYFFKLVYNCTFRVIFKLVYNCTSFLVSYLLPAARGWIASHYLIGYNAPMQPEDDEDREDAFRQAASRSLVPINTPPTPTGKVPPRLTRKRDGFTRDDVVKALGNAFEMIGGTTRLALWANQNPGDFYKLYARMLPAQAAPIMQVTGEKLTLIMATDSSPLDQHPPSEVFDINEMTKNGRD